ncbi:MAG: hypothetical protein ACI9EK_002511 [Psychroserpens sp.]|jgi:hypothetical protein
MKLFLKICMFFFIIGVQAQGKISPDVFKYTMTDEKKAFVGIKSIMNPSVFINNELTASQNYTKVYAYIKSKYEYPEDAIISKLEPTLLVIQETINNLYTSVSMGFSSSFDIRYNMRFDMNNGVIQCTVNNMLLGNTAALNRTMETEWNPVTGLYLHKKNGKPKKSMKGITDVKIENHFNKIIDTLQTF